MKNRLITRVHPTPKSIKKLRGNLTQSECADLIGITLRQWQRYEEGASKMPCGLWELFEIKMEVHPRYGKRIGVID